MAESIVRIGPVAIGSGLTSGSGSFVVAGSRLLPEEQSRSSQERFSSCNLQGQLACRALGGNTSWAMFLYMDKD